MKRLVTFFLVCFLTSEAQYDFKWLSKERISEYAFGRCISIGPEGSVYLSGNFKGNFRSSDSMVMGEFLSRYDKAGTLLWHKEFYSPYKRKAELLTVCDKKGNVFMAGESINRQMFRKYSSEGDLVFSKEIPKHGSAKAICLDSQNNILLAGYSPSLIPFEGQQLTSNTFIAKYQPDGTFLWVKPFFIEYLSPDNSFDMVVDEQNYIYTTGNYRSSLDFAPGVQFEKPRAGDGFVAKYNQEAELIWVEKISGENSQYPTSITINKKGDVFVAGYYSNALVMGTYTAEPSRGSADAFVAKYSNNGGFQWVRTGGSRATEYCHEIYADNADNVFVIGGFNYSLDPTFGDQVLQAGNKYGYNLLLLHYKSDGSLISARCSEGPDPCGGEGYYVTGDGNGSLYISGIFAGDHRFINSYANAANEAFVMKFSYDPGNSTGTGGINRILHELQLFPNPTPGPFSVASDSERQIEVRMIDATGRIVFSKSIDDTAAPIDPGPLTRGIYLVEVLCGEQKSIKKLVVQ